MVAAFAAHEGCRRRASSGSKGHRHPRIRSNRRTAWRNDERPNSRGSEGPCRDSRLVDGAPRLWVRERLVEKASVAIHGVGLTFFRSGARGLHVPARLTPESAKYEARKRRANE